MVHFGNFTFLPSSAKRRWKNLCLAGFTALLLAAGTTIAASPAKPATSPTPAPLPAWVSEKLTTDSLEQHRGEPGVVRLIWKTQSEQNSFGFYVMRGDNNEGLNFKPVNQKVILGAGNSSTENSYEYYDIDVKVGETYYYYLEEIDINGNRKKFSPVLPRRVQYRNLKAIKEHTAASADATTHALKPVLKLTSTSAERQVAEVTATPAPTATLPPSPTAKPTVPPTPTASPSPTPTPTAPATATPMAKPSPTPEPTNAAPPVAPSTSASTVVHFEKGSDALSSETQRVLATLAEALKQNPAMRVRIVGHSDSTGTPEANQAFAERRAWNVREALLNAGAARKQLILGNNVLHQAAEEGNDAARMAANRRVEVSPASSGSQQE
jgi:outer membrane protein OmpA-like peptidoglycan-associated protein